MCAKYPNIVIVKQYHPRKPLRIASDEGTRFKKKVLKNHINSDCHKACASAVRVTSISTEDLPSTSMEVSIRKANREQVRYVGKLMLQVFLDGKILSLAAYNWPARYIIAEASSTYDVENQSSRVVADNINLQYVNPHGHLESMSTIVKSDRSNFVKKINEARAISLRSDGSVDFTNIRGMFILARYSVTISNSFKIVSVCVSVRVRADMLRTTKN